MANEMELTPDSTAASDPHAQVEMPRPTIAPMLLSLGLILAAGGAILGLPFLLVGLVIFVIGLGLWIASLLPGRGHVHEEVTAQDCRERTIATTRPLVEQLTQGMPGYRVQLPQKVQPISAGVKGGIIGGLVMPLPALIYSLLSGHGIWYPVNLLAGMLVPGVGDMSVRELEGFHLGLLVSGLLIHAMSALVLGLIYGVLLPTLPEMPGEATWGGLLVPLLWSGLSFVAMSIINPAVRNGVSWPFFMMSQFVFGVATATIVQRRRPFGTIRAGIIGGVAGGVFMVIPALVWGAWSGHGPWYPVNLLAGMVLPGIDQLPAIQLNRFHESWFLAATALHVVISIAFGIGYALFLNKLPHVPGALTWGGLLFPLLWTGISFGLMGVVNPVLHERVDWPWFVISQFVFGATAAYVVSKSEMIAIPAAGGGPPR
jgi:hypothetical protein